MKKNDYLYEKYENGEWSKVYYDGTLNSLVSTYNDDHNLDLILKPENSDLVALKVANSRKSKKSLKTRANLVIGLLSISLLTSLGFNLHQNKVINSIKNNNVIEVVTNDEVDSEDILAGNVETTIFDIIDNNSTIDDEYKAILNKFFVSYSNLFSNNKLENIKTTIQNSDFSKISATNEDMVIDSLVNILGASNDISIKYIAREYYEYYYSNAASLNSRLFDAITASVDDTAFLTKLFDDGDTYYLNFLNSKYEDGESVLTYLKSADKGDLDNVDIEEYIYDKLMINYSNGDKYLHSLDEYYDYSMLENGLCDYSNNIFSNFVRVDINNYGPIYKTIYNKEDGADMTREYYKTMFASIISNIGDVDYSNANYRMYTYINVLSALTKSYDSLYSVGEYYLGTNLYSYLSYGEYDIHQIIDTIIAVGYDYGIDTDILPLLDEFMSCLKYELELGNINSNTYSAVVNGISEYLSNSMSDDELNAWKNDISLSTQILTK
jgi:hypothetical protein